MTPMRELWAVCTPIFFDYDVGRSFDRVWELLDCLDGELGAKGGGIDDSLFQNSNSDAMTLLWKLGANAGVGMALPDEVGSLATSGTRS